MDKYQFVPIATANPSACLYDNGKATLFQLFCLRNGKALCQSEMPRYPMVYKHLHVKYLTYTYKDQEGNEYKPYYGQLDVCNSLDATSIETSHTSESKAPCLVGLSTVRKKGNPLT